MKKNILAISIFIVFSFVNPAIAFKQPKADDYFREWIEEYKTVVEGLGPIPVEIIKNKKPSKPSLGDKKKYDKYFKKDNNQSAIVFKKSKLVYETYNAKWNGSKTNLIHGQSMTKTITGLTIGTLICSGKIKSIDDHMGKYSPTLANTPYNTISIRKALQMRSGVSKYDPNGTWDIWWMVTGDKKRGFSGKNHLKKYIKTIKSEGGDGNLSEYHPHDSHALTIMTTDITSKSLGKNFYENIFNKIKPSGDFVWMTDADGISIPTSGLFLQARDWAKVGDFINQSVNNKSCIGDFIKEGINKASKSTRLKGWKYGYHFWTNKGLIILAGFGGQVMYINPNKKSVVMASSVNPKYGKKSIFGIAAEVVQK